MMIYPGIFCLLWTLLWTLHVIAVSVDCSVPPLSLPWSNITVSKNGVAVSRGIELGIGTPNQVFSFRPSTTVNNTRVANVHTCGSEANTSCVGAKGGVFDSSQSSSFVVSLKTRWNGSAADTEGDTGAYVYFNDVMDFQAKGSLLGYPMVEDSVLYDGPQGGLPLGQNSSFLAAVTESRVAPSSVWGLDAGDRSLSPRDGRLVIGGYDTSRLAGNLSTFHLGNWTSQLPCPLQVRVTAVTYVFPNGSLGSVLGGSDLDGVHNDPSGMAACVEPFQERFTFTPLMVERLVSITGYDNSTNSPYSGLNFPAHSRPKGTLQIKLDNGYTTTIPNEQLFTLKRGSDDNGLYVITNSSVFETGIAYNVDDDPKIVQPRLGGLYLTFNYLIVDYDNGKFQMAPNLNEAPGPSASITTLCTPSSVDSNLHPNQTTTSHGHAPSRAVTIGGGTTGAIVGLAAIVGLGMYLLHKRRQNRQRKDQNPAEETVSPDDTLLDGQMQAELALTTTPTCHGMPDGAYEKELPSTPRAFEMPSTPRAFEMPI